MRVIFSADVLQLGVPWALPTSGPGHSLGDCPGLCWGLSSIPGPHPLDARGTPSVTTTDIPRQHPVSLGTDTPELRPQV